MQRGISSIAQLLGHCPILHITLFPKDPAHWTGIDYPYYCRFRGLPIDVISIARSPLPDNGRIGACQNFDGKAPQSFHRP